MAFKDQRRQRMGWKLPKSVSWRDIRDAIAGPSTNLEEDADRAREMESLLFRQVEGWYETPATGLFGWYRLGEESQGEFYKRFTP